MNFRLLTLLLILLSFTQACKTKENAEKSNLNYIQNIEQATYFSVQNSTSTLQPGDRLEIFITAKDMDVTKPYNQRYSSTEYVGASSGALPTTNANSAAPVYIVDTNNDIDFPGLGILNTKDKTVLEFREDLKNRLTRYIIDPTVNIKLLNFKVSVLGEVTKQGDYVLPNGEGTIINALAMAGDLTMYGKRDDITIVRTQNGVVTHGKINLQDANFINSAYYQLKQGDAIIVNANENKEIIARQKPNTTIILTAISLAITSIAVVVSLIK